MRIVAVLVLYGLPLQKSPTFRSLVRAAPALSEQFSSFKLLVYDNSPALDAPCASEGLRFEYVADPANGGLAAAYNYGLQAAIKDDVKWLLLLDQDTEFDNSYVSALADALNSAAGDPLIAAAIPLAICRGVVVSPVRESWTGRVKGFRSTDQNPINDRRVFAINSGTVVSVSFLAKLGGFDYRFWLDYLDYWLFEQIHRRQKTIAWITSEIQHGLSVSDMASLSSARYQNILAAERTFYRSYRGRGNQVLLILRLLGRALRQRYFLGLPRLASVSLKGARLLLTNR